MTPPTTTTTTAELAPKPRQYFGEGKTLPIHLDGELKNNNGVLEVTGETNVSYPKYLPVWDTNLNYEPLTEFEHEDPGLRADPSFPNLLKDGVIPSDITPKFGTEIRGIQLSSLDDKGKDELALFVAQRGVVAFREQDFADLPISDALDYGRHFGRLHIHPSSGAPKDYPEVHLVHRTASQKKPAFFDYHTSSVQWHTDVSYEKQPPGTTFLYLLDGPESGGDTIFSDQVEAYERLSDGFKSRLSGLKAVHSGYEQYQDALAQNHHVRRAPVANEHPLVRTHPATRKKALYVNEQFTRSIVGFKKEESDAILNFLYDHNAKGTDFQARVKWEPRTVVVWDNRRALHSALYDWDSNQRRHMARVTPQAEVPRE